VAIARCCLSDTDPVQTQQENLRRPQRSTYCPRSGRLRPVIVTHTIFDFLGLLPEGEV
jgi:hypothetical protein